MSAGAPRRRPFFSVFFFCYFTYRVLPSFDTAAVRTRSPRLHTRPPHLHTRPIFIPSSPRVLDVGRSMLICISSGSLPGFTRFYWVLLGFTGFYRDLTEFYQVLLGFTKFHLVLPSFPGFCRALPGFYRVLTGFNGILPPAVVKMDGAVDRPIERCVRYDLHRNDDRSMAAGVVSPSFTVGVTESDAYRFSFYGLPSFYRVFTEFSEVAPENWIVLSITTIAKLGQVVGRHHPIGLEGLRGIRVSFTGFLLPSCCFFFAGAHRLFNVGNNNGSGCRSTHAGRYLFLFISFCRASFSFLSLSPPCVCVFCCFFFSRACSQKKKTRAHWRCALFLWANRKCCHWPMISLRRLHSTGAFLMLMNCYPITRRKNPVKLGKPP